MVAESVRARIVAEASRTLGREVAVTRLSGDPIRGIVIEGVRVAGPSGATGAFFEAPRVVAQFDAKALLIDLLHGRGVIKSLTALELDRPFLVLARDERGHWNYEDLLAGQKGAPPAFTARVEVREGSLVFSDALRRLQVPFSAHFDRITGTLRFSEAPRVSMVLDAVNKDGRTPALLHVAGKATLGEGTFDLDLSTSGASVAHWGPYLVRLPWLAWRGGTFDGAIHLLASKWGRSEVLDYRGRLTLRDGRALLLPQQTLLSDVDGPLSINSLEVSTEGLTMAVGLSTPTRRSESSPMWVRGAITHLAGVHLDLAVRSSFLDLATLQALLFPKASVRLGGRARGDVRIVGPLESPRVEGTIAQASGSINRQRFSDFSASFLYYGGLLAFDDVAASTGGGRAQGHLRLHLGQGSFFALADLRGVDTSGLPGLGVTTDPTLRGNASGFVAAAGTPREVMAQGRVQLGPGSVQGVAFDGVETLFGFDRGRVEVDRFEARSGVSQVHGVGEITHQGALDLALVAKDVDLQKLGLRFGLKRWLAGTADLVGSLTGSTKAPVLSGQVAARAGRLGPFPFDDARGDIRLTTTDLATSGMVLRDGGGRYEATGAVRWDVPGRVDLTVRVEDVPAHRLLAIANVPLQLSGTVRGTVRLSGAPNNPQAAGSVQLDHSIVVGQRVDRAQADFRWTGSQLLLDRAVASVNSSSVEARGTISRSGALGITFAAHGFTLADAGALQSDVLRVTGTADLVGTLEGNVASPTLSATVSSTSLELNGQRFDHAMGRVRYSQRRLTLSPLVLEQGPGTFQLSGHLRFHNDPEFDLRVDAHTAQLSTLLGLAEVAPPFALGGTMDGHVVASGRLSNANASLDVHLVNGRIGDHMVREATISAGLADHVLTLETFSLKPMEGELVGAGRIDLRGGSEVEFDGRQLSLDILRPLFALQRPLAGTLDLTLQISGQIADPVVGLAASVANGRIASASFDRLVLQAFYQDGLFHIEQGLLQEGRHRAKLEGTVPFNPARLRFDESKSMNLRLSLPDADLSLLGLVTDRVEQAQGPLVGEVLVTGTTAQPKMDGSLAVADGLIKLRGVDPPLTALRARLTFDQDEVRVAQASASAGDGTVTVTGTVGIRNFRPDRLNLQLTADAARLIYAPVFSGVADGTLRLGGTAARPVISGTLTLSGGDLLLASGVLPTPEGREGAGIDPVLDVDLRAGDGLWVNLGSLRAQVRGMVHAAGTWQRPVLAGEVSAERGTFTAFNNTFTLIEGRAAFAELRGTTPVLDARAETRMRVARVIGEQTRVETARVFLHIQGTPDNLSQPELTAEPPLSREEILAGLARQAGITQLLRGDLENALRAELSSVLFGSVGQATARTLGLEEFQIEYDFVRPLQLKVGKLLISNLYVTLTSEFATPRRYIWALEYRFTPNTMLAFSIDNRSRYDLLYLMTHRF